MRADTRRGWGWDRDKELFCEGGSDANRLSEQLTSISPYYLSDFSDISVRN